MASAAGGGWASVQATAGDNVRVALLNGGAELYGEVGRYMQASIESVPWYLTRAEKLAAKNPKKWDLGVSSSKVQSQTTKRPAEMARAFLADYVSGYLHNRQCCPAKERSDMHVLPQVAFLEQYALRGASRLDFIGRLYGSLDLRPAHSVTSRVACAIRRAADIQ